MHLLRLESCFGVQSERGALEQAGQGEAVVFRLKAAEDKAVRSARAEPEEEAGALHL